MIIILFFKKLNTSVETLYVVLLKNGLKCSLFFNVVSLKGREECLECCRYLYSGFKMKDIMSVRLSLRYFW